MPTSENDTIVFSINKSSSQLCLHRRIIQMCLRSTKARPKNYRSTMPTSKNDTNVFAINNYRLNNYLLNLTTSENITMNYAV